MKVSAIVLSAGQSTRMQPLPHKGLIPWEGTTLFEHQLQVLLKCVISEIIVVVGYMADVFKQKSKAYPVKIVNNENYELGKCSSIIKGLQSIVHSTELILITAVDQPTDVNIVNRLIQSLQNSQSPIAIPIYKGKRGHPILFSANIINELLSIQEETLGLRKIIRKYEKQITEVVIESPLIKLNINSPGDYEQAQSLFRNSQFEYRRSLHAGF
ncbi:nucleotidyltransferase family protein [Cytobacillus depressus]|uniref:Nucleotidyltransferase family protein n=1 Tax=Cytobacillus depressus TaxID=1602942 RepID=A0A6L3V390_9BACI|nr:nucleotidyltransferase family protein [Cytobacillus depressus]KAB2331528.1 nucleotidyltransferase family protein [Cytobacillus depressus]